MPQVEDELVYLPVIPDADPEVANQVYAFLPSTS
jgi:hypothetical protein